MTGSPCSPYAAPGLRRTLLYATLLCALLIMPFALPAAASAPRQDDTGAEQTGTEQTGAEQTGTEQTGTEQTGTEQTETETGTAATSVVITPPRPVPTGQDLLGLTVIILGFAIGAVAAALLYSYNIQIKYYDAATRLGVSGVPVKTSSGGDFADLTQQDDSGNPLQATPVITGPTPVTVGVQSGEFSATVAGRPLEQAVWFVAPPNMAIAMPPSGADKVKLIAAMPGAFKLIVQGKIGGADTAPAGLDVVAVAGPRDPIELPFVGRAYGSVVLGIILTAAVILLALAGLLSEAVVVALLTTLLGYTFGIAVANRPQE